MLFFFNSKSCCRFTRFEPSVRHGQWQTGRDRLVTVMLQVSHETVTIFWRWIELKFLTTSFWRISWPLSVLYFVILSKPHHTVFSDIVEFDFEIFLKFCSVGPIHIPLIQVCIMTCLFENFLHLKFQYFWYPWCFVFFKNAWMVMCQLIHYCSIQKCILECRIWLGWIPKDQFFSCRDFS